MFTVKSVWKNAWRKSRTTNTALMKAPWSCTFLKGSKAKMSLFSANITCFLFTAKRLSCYRTPICVGLSPTFFQFLLSFFYPNSKLWIIANLQWHYTLVHLSLTFGFHKITQISWLTDPGGLRRRTVAVRLLGPWVRIPPWAWIFATCEYCIGRGLWDGPITRPGESYRQGMCPRVWPGATITLCTYNE